METERDYKADWGFESRVSDEYRKMVRRLFERNSHLRIKNDDLKVANSGLKVLFYISALSNIGFIFKIWG